MWANDQSAGDAYGSAAVGGLAGRGAGYGAVRGARWLRDATSFNIDLSLTSGDLVNAPNVTRAQQRVMRNVAASRGTRQKSQFWMYGTEVSTPWGPAFQDRSAAALRARADVEAGAVLWRTGTAGRSQTNLAQFWAFEHPFTPGFAEGYGIPPQNLLHADFIQSAVPRPGARFVTRRAPGYGPNGGGRIEVVAEGRGIWFRGYSARLSGDTSW